MENELILRRTWRHVSLRTHFATGNEKPLGVITRHRRAGSSAGSRSTAPTAARQDSCSVTMKTMMNNNIRQKKFDQMLLMHHNKTNTGKKINPHPAGGCQPLLRSSSRRAVSQALLMDSDPPARLWQRQPGAPALASDGNLQPEGWSTPQLYKEALWDLWEYFRTDIKKANFRGPDVTWVCQTSTGSGVSESAAELSSSKHSSSAVWPWVSSRTLRRFSQCLPHGVLDCCHNLNIFPSLQSFLLLVIIVLSEKWDWGSITFPSEGQAGKFWPAPNDFVSR